MRCSSHLFPSHVLSAPTAFRLPTFGGSSSESKENAPVGATAQGAAEAISAPYEGREYHIGSRLIFRPAQFKTEGALLGLCVLYLALHFAGKTINQSRARAFAKAATPMLNSEFFLVARVREDKDVMMWNGGDEAVMYASGRRGVDS